MLLKVVKTFAVHGRVFQVGETIRVADGQDIVNMGYARVLTSAESMDILGEYVLYVKRLSI